MNLIVFLVQYRNFYKTDKDTSIDYFISSSYAFIDDRIECGKRMKNWRIRFLEGIAKNYNTDQINREEVEEKLKEILFGNKLSIFLLIENDLFYIYHRGKRKGLRNKLV